jgi:hypothetical protein
MQHRNVLQSISAESTVWLHNFVSVYEKLSINNLDLLNNIYHKDILFEDPIHKIEGVDNLHNYFNALYHNLISCDFVIEEVIVQDLSAALYWKMTYQHAKLNQGKTVTISGNSHIKAQDDKVIYHKDHFDLGAMIYEQLPVMGKLVRWVKARAAK